MADQIFINYSTPFCTKSDVTAQLTLGIIRENLPKKCRWGLSIDAVASRKCVLTPTAATNQVPRLLAAHQLMSTTLLLQAVLTLGASQKYASRNLSLIAASMTWPAIGWRLHFLQRAAVCNAERCNTQHFYPSVRPSHAGTLSRRMKIGSCGLHGEIAKTLNDTKNGCWRRPLPPKICAQSDPPPEFDQYLHLTSQP